MSSDRADGPFTQLASASICPLKSTPVRLSVSLGLGSSGMISARTASSSRKAEITSSRESVPLPLSSIITNACRACSRITLALSTPLPSPPPSPPPSRLAAAASSCSASTSRYISSSHFL